MAIEKTNKIIRTIRGPAVEDPSSIQVMTYNEAAGAQKNMDAGHHLVPMNVNATTFTTDATTARSVGMGKTLAIYNNSATVQAATLGDDAAMTALAVGAVDAAGNVGIPCQPNTWTYIATNNRQFVRTSNASLLVMIVKDDTSITNQGR